MATNPAIYKDGTQEWVQALDPFTLVDVSNLPDLNAVEILYFETDQEAQQQADLLTDQHQVEFKVGRPDDRHGH